MKVDAKKINWLDHDGSSLDELPRPARSRDKKVTRNMTIKKIYVSASSPVSVRSDHNKSAVGQKPLQNQESLCRYTIA